MDSCPHDVLSTTHSGGSWKEPLVVRSSRGTQEEDGLQHRLSLPGAVPIRPLVDLSSGDIQCLAAPASPTMSPKARGSDSEVCTDAEQEWDICHTGVPLPRTASSEDVNIITANEDDAGTFNQQPHIQARNDIGLAVESFSHRTPTDSSAKGRSDPCEQLIESRGTSSPGRVSLEPNPAPVGADTAGLGWPSSTQVADAALAKALPDEPSHTVGVARTIEPHTRRARSERDGSIDCRSTRQRAWTSGQDEQLLHLRDIAQLNWRNTVNYFPEMTLMV